MSVAGSGKIFSGREVIHAEKILKSASLEHA